MLNFSSASVPPQCYQNSMSNTKIPLILPKVQMAAYNKTHMHLYVALNKVNCNYCKLVHGVHRTCAEMAAVSCGTNHN